MKLSVIKTEKEYEDLLEWTDTQFDKKVNQDSREGRKLEVALVLIMNYEVRTIQFLYHKKSLTINDLRNTIHEINTELS